MTALVCPECAPVVSRLESALSVERELREKLGDLAARRCREIVGFNAELTSVRDLGAAYEADSKRARTLLDLATAELEALHKSGVAAVHEAEARTRRNIVSEVHALGRAMSERVAMPSGRILVSQIADAIQGDGPAQTLEAMLKEAEERGRREAVEEAAQYVADTPNRIATSEQERILIDIIANGIRKLGGGK